MSKRLSAVGRRKLLRALALAGPLTSAAPAAQAPAASRKQALERRIAHLQPIRDFVFEDESIEPANMFSARR